MKLRIFLGGLLLAASCYAAHLSAQANGDFDRYVAALEKRLGGQHQSPVRYIATLPSDPAQRSEIERDLRSGTVRVQAINGGSWAIDGGLMHHWRAAAFVPHATRKSMLALLQDYSRFSRYYQPEVVSSHLIRENGGRATLAMRIKKQSAVTVVFDAEYQVESGHIGDGGGFSVSRSTHIWQVDSPGTPRERRRPEGDDDGLLWRINAYWSFLEERDGLLIECEAVSLTRDVPAGLGWLIVPIIRELPRSSLESTLTATRKALQQ